MCVLSEDPRILLFEKIRKGSDSENVKMSGWDIVKVDYSHLAANCKNY